MGIIAKLKNYFSPDNACFMFHSIGLSEHEGPLGEVSLSEQDFVRAIDYISNNYEVISVAEYSKTFTSFGRTKVASITFDDGYTDNLSIAYPILKQRQLPFTVFITADHITRQSIPFEFTLYEYLKENKIFTINTDSGIKNINHSSLNVAYADIREEFFKSNTFFRDNLGLYKSLQTLESKYHQYFLDESQLKKLSSDELVSIGYHGNTHKPLTQNSDVLIIDLFDKGVNLLESIVGDTIDSISYPYGMYNNKVLRAAHKFGFKYGLSTNRSKNYNRFTIPRIDVNKSFVNEL
ncbi:MAG: polysaccharide deacetylase family protein [Bacteroidota bacterium]